jgi:hypothetical protein
MLTAKILGLDNLHNKSINEIYQILKLVHKLPFFDNSVSIKIKNILHDKLVVESFFNSNSEIDQYLINNPFPKNSNKEDEKRSTTKKINKKKRNNIIKKDKSLKKKRKINTSNVIQDKSIKNNIKKCIIKKSINDISSKFKNNTKKIYICDICKINGDIKEYSGASGLWYHMKHIHNKKTNIRNKKKIKKIKKE